MNPTIAYVNAKSMKSQIPDVVTGDIVRVSQKIQEGAKVRTQVFEGIVIERSGGKSLTASITVRKIASGVGVEKKYLLNSPTIEKITVLRSSKVRRKKIFFLRDLVGKATRLKERKRVVLETTGVTVAEEPVEVEDILNTTAETAEDVAVATNEAEEALAEAPEVAAEEVVEAPEVVAEGAEESETPAA